MAHGVYIYYYIICCFLVRCCTWYVSHVGYSTQNE